TGSYEWSPDLVNWYAGDGVDGPLSGLTVLITANPSGNTTTVTATTSEAYSSIFLRGRADQNL
ncbi:MAG: hypothetical protein N2F24_14630, partial [Deltaproteobacteria bacterium]